MNLPKQESCLRWPVCKYSDEPTCPMECGHFIDSGIEQENAELRATIADNGREIDKKNMEIEHWKGLATHGCSNESECCPYYCMNEAAEAELAELRERMKPVEEVYKEHEVWAREWLSTAPVSSRSRMLEFWQAICKAMEGK